VRVAAARLRSRPAWTLAELVSRLRQERSRLDELDPHDDEGGGVTAALDLSYQHVDPVGRRAYRMLGLHSGPDPDAAAVAAMLGVDEVEAGATLEALLDIHLLEERPAGRYRLHDLTRSHAARSAALDEPEPARRAALGRVLDHYGAWATAAMDVAHPYTRSRRPPAVYDVPAEFPTVASAVAWLDAELPNILATLQAAVREDEGGHAIAMSAILHRHLIERGLLDEAIGLHRLALATATERDDRPRPQARCFKSGRSSGASGTTPLRCGSSSEPSRSPRPMAWCSSRSTRAPRCCSRPGSGAGSRRPRKAWSGC
jgi:hypothetical protein